MKLVVESLEIYSPLPLFLIKNDILFSISNSFYYSKYHIFCLYVTLTFFSFFMKIIVLIFCILHFTNCFINMICFISSCYPPIHSSYNNLHWHLIIQPCYMLLYLKYILCSPISAPYLTIFCWNVPDNSLLSILYSCFLYSVHSFRPGRNMTSYVKVFLIRTIITVSSSRLS